MLRAAASRLLLVLVLVGTGLAGGSGQAAAHGAGGLGPEAHLPRVLAVDPAVAGLAVTVIEAGARLRLDNATGVPVEVLAPPAGGAVATVPAVAPGATARWADPRVLAAAADPVPAAGHRDWAVPLRVGGQPVTVRGEQVWPPAPWSAPWWLAALLAAVLTGAIATRGVHRRRWAPALAGLAVAVAAAHAVHVLGSALIVQDRPLVTLVLGAAGPALLAWVLAPVGAGLTLAGRAYGPLLCALAGGILALVSAFAANNFGSAVLPFAGPAALDRAAVALSMGGGLGLFVAGFGALEALHRSAPAETG